MLSRWTEQQTADNERVNTFKTNQQKLSNLNNREKKKWLRVGGAENIKKSNIHVIEVPARRRKLKENISKNNDRKFPKF